MTDNSDDGVVDVDPVTAVSVASKAAKVIGPGDSKLRHLLFGPAFTEIGLWMGENIATRRKQNAERVLTDAQEMLDGRSPMNETDYVNPRLIKGAIEDGSWADDPICQSYLAGLLVGGRSSHGRDDSNVPWLSMSNAMSGAEVRLHFVVYRLLAQAFAEDKLNSKEFTSENLLWYHEVAIPVELRDDGLSTAILGLRQSGFLAQGYSINEAKDAFFVTPTHSGAALFLAVHGIKVTSPSRFLAFEQGWNPALDRHWVELDLTLPDPIVAWRSGAEFIDAES